MIYSILRMIDIISNLDSLRADLLNSFPKTIDAIVSFICSNTNLPPHLPPHQGGGGGRFVLEQFIRSINSYFTRMYKSEDQSFIESFSQRSYSQSYDEENNEVSEDEKNPKYILELWNTLWAIISANYKEFKDYKTTILKCMWSDLSWKLPSNSWSLITWNNILIKDSEFFYSFFMNENKQSSQVFQPRIEVIIKHKIDTWNVINYILYKFKNKCTFFGLDLETSFSPMLGQIPTPSYK